MVAVPASREPLSLLEQGVVKFARIRARSGKTSTGAFGWWVAELFGTVAALTAATVGAFWHAPPLVAWFVLTVALLLVDTKVSGARRARRALAAVSAPAPRSAASPRIVRE